MTELEKITELPEYKKVLNDYEEVLKHIEKSTQKPMRSLLDVFDIYQTLDAEMQMNLTLPEWTRNVFPDPISFIVGQQCNFENYNSILKRLNGGKIINCLMNLLLQWRIFRLQDAC